jgi:hypothetical protein
LRDRTQVFAITMHTQMHTFPPGFKGDELSLSAFTANSSALERSSRSSVSAIGLRGQE